MKLYNLFEEVIFEEIIKLVLLNEAVSINDINIALDGDKEKQGKFYYVSFNYRDGYNNMSERWGRVTQHNVTIANNEALDVYQDSRDGKSDGFNPRTKKQESFSGWKKFRLDRISNFKISRVPFYNVPNGFNKSTNNSKTIKSTKKIAKIGSYQYAPSTIQQKAAAEKKNTQNTVQEPTV